jgi:hypothetical protein
MLVLTWDQEKIVVLNLILFCYFLRYLVGGSIEETLGQRRVVLLDSLLADLNTQISLLSKLLDESKIVLNNYKILILSVLKKVLISTNNFLLLDSNVTTNILSVTNFATVQLALQIAYEESLIKQFDQNTFVASQIILDTSSLFTTELQGSFE